MQKLLITNISEKYIAMNSIILCLATIIFGSVWERIGDKFYKHYGTLLISESVFYIALITLVLTNSISYKFYYLIDTLLFTFITKNIIFGGNKLKSKRYKDSDRNSFDNNSTIVNNIASLLGFTISLLLNIDKTIAFLFMGIGVSVDNVFYYRAYKKT